MVLVFEEVIKRFTKVKLVIAGDGPLFKNIESMIKKKHLENYIKLLGFRRDTLEITKIFDVFLLTSHWEGTSRAMLEAMLLKVPVVSSDVGGHREVILDGITGFLVEPGNIKEFADKIFEIFNNPEKIIKMTQAAYNMVSTRFSLNNMIIEIENIYKKILMEKGRLSNDGEAN